MRWSDFPKWGRYVADWAADYHAGLRERPVRAQTKPGDIAAQLPLAAPEAAQPIDDVIADFESIVMPGITHWQHPRFFAYFQSNAAPASMIAEQFTNAIASWQKLRLSGVSLSDE